MYWYCSVVQLFHTSYFFGKKGEKKPWKHLQIQVTNWLEQGIVRQIRISIYLMNALLLQDIRTNITVMISITKS